MGRRKKQPIEEEKQTKTSLLHSDVKRSVAAIFLFALAVLFVLAFLSDAKILDAGLLGKFLNSLAGWLFGVGKYISPLVLLGVGVILLFRKETAFYVSKILGLAVAFVSVLGLIHILAFEPEKMFLAAKVGEGGGFLGYAAAAALQKLTGTVGGSVILVALLLIGLVVAFNFSIVKFFERGLENDEPEAENDAASSQEVLEDPLVEHINEDKSKQTEFVHGPEQVEEEPKLKPSTLQKVVQWTPKKSNKRSAAKDQLWQLPPISLLETETGQSEGGDVKSNAKIIQDTFRHFGIEVEPGATQTGPTVTQYSFRPAVGVKLTRITSLNDDLALALASHPIRIEAPIPGKSLIGIEVRNKKAAKVRLPELLESPEFENRDSNLLLALGKDVSGNLIFGDLKKMPHLLIAGTTGSGKSISINAILLSLLYQNSPEDLKLILVDPKRVELSLYNGIPHLLADVIVDNSKVLGALKWAIGEMERRYKLLPQTGSKDIISFNKKAEGGEKRKFIDPETNETKEEPIEKLPYIVIIIDELADLMQSHGKEVEGAIIRLAQMARAVGIHLIVSTQKPVVTVITGLIKSNIPTRIAFKVPSLMDSRTILDASGAEKLLGFGDMLFSSAASSSINGIRRLQGVYISEAETKRVVEFVSRQKIEKLEDDLGEDIVGAEEKDPTKNGPVEVSYSTPGRIDFSSAMTSAEGDDDPLYEEAKKIVIQAGKASSSLLQRRLRIGYSRAARLVDILEDNGIIGSADGAKPREVLVGHDNQVEYEDPVSDQVQRDKWQM